MFNFDINNYIDNVAMTPNEMYTSLNQATLNDRWEDTTQLYTIKEQLALPFVDKYEEYEVWVDTVSDTLVNTSKNYSDFISVLFRNINHKQNYRGQYYKLSFDGEHEETFICYDRMNKLSQMPSFKCVRCNNELKWINSDGKIVTMPCYLGTDISSTNNLISKDGTVPNTRMVILVQANSETKKIVKNQRFMFEHSSAFKVEEVNNYMQEQDTNGEVTIIRIYIDYSAILPTDNKEMNICDYYNNSYSIDIAQDEISQVKGFVGSFVVTVKNGNEVVEVPLVWNSSDKSVVRVDENGNYTIVGDVGSTATITCSIKGNEEISDSVSLFVVQDYLPEKKLIVTPNDVTELKQNRSVEFNCFVEIEGESRAQQIDCVTDWTDEKYFKLEETLNGYKLTNICKSSKPLNLRFVSNGCEDVKYTIKLIGLL